MTIQRCGNSAISVSRAGVSRDTAETPYVRKVAVTSSKPRDGRLTQRGGLLVAHDSRGIADDNGEGGDIPRDDGASAHHRSFTDRDAGQNHRSRPDTRATTEGRRLKLERLHSPIWLMVDRAPRRQDRGRLTAETTRWSSFDLRACS